MSFVYFVETACGGYIKIGYSKDPSRRKAEFGTLRPKVFEARMIGWIPGDVGLEHQLHSRFAEHRDNGEWFRRCAELEAYIAEQTLIMPLAREVKPAPVALEPELITFRENGTRSFTTQRAGRLGGLALAAKLTPEQRREKALVMVRARWEKSKQERDRKKKRRKAA